MFIDARASVAVIAREPEASAYGADNLWTSPLAAWEAIIVLSRPDKLDCAFRESEQVVRSWLAAQDIELRVAASASEILKLAVSIAESHGTGKRALSSVDCFHCACAKSANQPLLTLDRLLRETDVETRPRQG